MACHEAATDRDKVGPHLLGVVGRTAGTPRASSATIRRR